MWLCDNVPEAIFFLEICGVIYCQHQVFGLLAPLFAFGAANTIYTIR